MSASVITCCDASPVLELCKEVFHPVPGFVSGLAVFDCFFTVFLRWDAGRDLLFSEQIADFVAVISTITD